MFQFQAQNEDFNEGEKTALSATALKGQKTLNVLNGSNFTNVKHLRVGRKGDEITELAHIDSITGNVITLTTNLNSDHLVNTEIVQLYFDQRKLYKEQNAGKGDYAIVGSAKDIQLDNPDGTIFTDANGVTGIYYKCTYFDSVGMTESSLSDAVATLGDTTYYAQISDVRNDAGFADNAFIADADILQSIKDSESEINGKLAAVYVLPFSYVPAIIRDICAMLTVGRLFQSEYPGIDPQYDKVGSSRTTEARKLLDDIFNRRIILTDDSAVELLRVQTNQPSGWPNGSTASLDTEDHGGDNMFRAGMIF